MTSTEKHRTGDAVVSGPGNFPHKEDSHIEKIVLSTHYHPERR
jgi:hypothetical protein